MELRGVVTAVRYHNPETAFSVLSFSPEGAALPVTVVGPLLGVDEGEPLKLSGEWVENARYGRQFRADSYQIQAPQTLQGIERYLRTAKLPGIGPTTAARLVKHFKLETLRVLDRAPHRLREVPGIGLKRSQQIEQAWKASAGDRDRMVFLQSLGLPAGLASRIIRAYGARTQAVVREDPYQLALEITGVGFLTADRLGRQLGISREAPRRLQAGLLHILAEAAGDGHLFLPREELLARTARLLSVEVGAEQLSAIELEGRAVLDAERVYAAPLFTAERSVAQAVLRQLSGPKIELPAKIEDAIDVWEGAHELELAEGQRAALLTALGARLAVITGGPGTGKTTIIRALVQLLGAMKATVELAAPTGRAAKRMQEATGEEARTIHRLLEVNPETLRFSRDADCPLETDVIIIDESSMIDVFLFASLLDAVPPHARLILVGDADQLPPVGPGQVFGDLIASGQVPVARLSQVYRQGEESRIVYNAYQIIQGELPKEAPRGQKSDYYFFGKAEPAEAILELVTRHLPSEFQLSAEEDIQVLSPMRKGPLGTTALNRRLQEVLRHPAEGAGLLRGEQRYLPGDRIIQVKNNYELGVYNGDLGRVLEVNPKEGRLIADFEGERIEYTRALLSQLELAYAITVHKSQGSEYPAVVMPISQQHRIMLHRKLLYTAVTRARQLLVLVGSRQALAMAVRSLTDMRRNSQLVERVQAGLLTLEAPL